jgi:hypothetical protein
MLLLFETPAGYAVFKVTFSLLSYEKEFSVNHLL